MERELITFNLELKYITGYQKQKHKKEEMLKNNLTNNIDAFSIITL